MDAGAHLLNCLKLPARGLKGCPAQAKPAVSPLPPRTPQVPLPTAACTERSEAPPPSPRVLPQTLGRLP